MKTKGPRALLEREDRGMAQIKWLENLLRDDFLPRLAEATNEEQVRQLCQAFIDSWQDPGRSFEYIARNLYPLTRNRIRESVLLSLEIKIVALDVIDLPEETWIVLNEPGEKSLDDRLAHQLFIRDPDAIVARARAILEDLEHLSGEEWPKVAVALAIVSGRRFAEIMKKIVASVKTPYSVLLTNLAKRPKEEEQDPVSFEAPTLIEAELVCRGFEWLRTQVDCTLLSANEVSGRYGKPVRQMTDLIYHDLIPTREGKALYTHICRSVYALLADFYYGPPHVASLRFRQTVLGHFRQRDASGELRQSYTSAAHYFDYALEDEHGEPDNRRGTLLGMVPGVVVLEEFDPEKQKIQERSDQSVLGKGADAEAQKKKKRNSPINVKPEDRDLFVDLNKFALRKRTQSEALRYLIIFYRTHQNIALGQQKVDKLALDDLAIDEEARETIRQGMAVSGETDVLTFLSHSAVQIAKKRMSEAVYWTVDFSTMPTSELLEERRPGALKEKVRRGLIAGVMHNQAVQDPKLRWFLNTNVVKALVGGRPPAISDILLKEYAQRLERHHTQLQISPSQNRNPKLAVEIKMPEDPMVYSQERERELLGPCPAKEPDGVGTVQEK